MFAVESRMKGGRNRRTCLVWSSSGERCDSVDDDSSVGGFLRCKLKDIDFDSLFGVADSKKNHSLVEFVK